MRHSKGALLLGLPIARVKEFPGVSVPWALTLFRMASYLLETPLPDPLTLGY